MIDGRRPRPLLTWQWLDNWHPSQGTPANIRTNIIFLETSIIDLHFAADSVCLSSFKFFWQAPREYFISARVTFRPFKDVQGRHFGANRKHVYDFLLVRHSNLSLVLSCTVSEILQVFCAPDPTPIPPQFWGCSRYTRWPMLGSAGSRGLKLFGREIIFEEFQPMRSRYLNVTLRQMLNSEYLKTLGSPWIRPRSLLSKILMGFCSDGHGPYQSACQIWSP